MKEIYSQIDMNLFLIILTIVNLLMFFCLMAFYKLDLKRINELKKELQLIKP